jgi:hypothetical protein
MREPTELGSDTDQFFQTQRQCTKSNKIKSQKEKSIWSSSTIARGVLIKSRREAAIPKSEQEKKEKNSYIRYVQDYSRNQKSAAVRTGDVSKLLGQPEENIFDYFVLNIVDYGVNCGLPCSGARRHALVQIIGNARGLDINSPLSAKAHTQGLRFRRHRHSQATQQSQQCSGARQQLRLRSWIRFYDNNSTTSSSTTVAPTAAHR